MSGSSGNVSGRVITPTTSHGEERRQAGALADAIPGIHEQNQREGGVISKIHPEQAGWVKVRALDGTPLANNNWIELNHHTDEIIERWGTVRVGMKVRVAYSGPAGAGADCTIVGTEGDDPTHPHVPNEVARGMYSMFSPGIGIG